jgi:regulatory protein
LQGTVTALRLQAKDHNRVSVFLDGAYGFGLAKVLAVRLRVGQVLGEAEVAGLQRQDQEEAAFHHAVGLIGRRPRSVQELRKAMGRREVAPEVQEAVLGRLQVQGLLDDQAFAAAWVENRRAFRPRSRMALRAELRRKGIDRTAMDAALAEWDETAAALEAGRRAARRYTSLPEREFIQKVMSSLSRRGFDHETSTTVARQIWQETTLR